MIFFCSQVPVLNDVRDITLSKDGKGALVSYENKVRASTPILMLY
jgi:hypothetical protein